MTNVDAALVHQVANCWTLARTTSNIYDQIANLAPPLFALQWYAGFAQTIAVGGALVKIAQIGERVSPSRPNTTELRLV